MRILFVEDEKHFAEAVAAVMRKSNYTVDLAYNGENGLDSALSDIYDIIVLDIMLPKMNGIDILKELRRKKITTPVLLYSPA